MKHGIFLFMLVLAGFSPLVLSAQNGQPPRSMQEILMSHKWFPDIYDEEDEEISFFTYTKTQEIDTIITEDGELRTSVSSYYFSDTIEEFDPNKVGKNTGGTYMILYTDTNYPGVPTTYIYKLIEVLEWRLTIQHLTPGMSSYGHINTCYPTPLKRESVD
ncbi:MAG: hypothetical protein K2I90_11260 [Odoribacter sp.]|nr:hypothetical protein [Odoribacter sp.]